MASFMATYVDTDDPGRSTTKSIMISIPKYDEYSDDDKFKSLSDKVNHNTSIGGYMIPVNVIRL